MVAALLIITVLSAWLCHKLAKARHRQAWLWICLATLLGPIAVVVLLWLPESTATQPRNP